jgi:hypothetical protein
MQRIVPLRGELQGQWRRIVPDPYRIRQARMLLQNCALQHLSLKCLNIRQYRLCALQQ